MRGEISYRSPEKCIYTAMVLDDVMKNRKQQRKEWGVNSEVIKEEKVRMPSTALKCLSSWCGNILCERARTHSRIWKNVKVQSRQFFGAVQKPSTLLLLRTLSVCVCVSVTGLIWDSPSDSALCPRGTHWAGQQWGALLRCHQGPN